MIIIKQTIVFFALALSLISSVALCNETKLHSINVGIDLWPGYYPLLIAQHNGYFKEHNLEVKYVLPEETNNLMNMFNDNKIDLLCVAMGDAFVLYDEDPDMRVVMITDESLGGDALLTKSVLPAKGQPIKIGTNLQGFGELFVREYIKQSGRNKKDVIWVQQEASQAMDYLRTGKAHIVHTWEPYVSEIKTYFGAQVVFDSSQTPGLIPDALLANGAFIQNHPDKLKEFIAAWLTAASWWLDNRTKGDRIIENKLLLLPGTLSLQGIKLYTAKDNHFAFSQKKGGQSLYNTTQMYRDYFHAKKAFERLPQKPQDIITGEYLPK